MWYDRYRIGDGEVTTDEIAQPVYRSYPKECDIVVTKEVFDELISKYGVYIATSMLRDIKFKPKDVEPQSMTPYYFCHVQVKIPRPTS